MMRSQEEERRGNMEVRLRACPVGTSNLSRGCWLYSQAGLEHEATWLHLLHNTVSETASCKSKGVFENKGKKEGQRCYFLSHAFRCFSLQVH